MDTDPDPDPDTDADPGGLDEGESVGVGPCLDLVPGCDCQVTPPLSAPALLFALLLLRRRRRTRDEMITSVASRLPADVVARLRKR